MSLLGCEPLCPWTGGDCLLSCFATIDPPSEFEEGCEGETFAGEAEEEPGTTGKPPLALASLFTYNCLHLLWFQKLHYSNDGVSRGTPAFLYYHPSGCSPSVAPILTRGS